MAADHRALARAVEVRIRESGSFSGVAGLRLGGEDRWTSARGWASRQFCRRNAPGTVFGVAADRSIRFTVLSNHGGDFWDLVDGCIDGLFGP